MKESGGCPTSHSYAVTRLGSEPPYPSAALLAEDMKMRGGGFGDYEVKGGAHGCTFYQGKPVSRELWRNWITMNRPLKLLK